MKIAAAYLALFFGLGILAIQDPFVQAHAGLPGQLLGVLVILLTAVLALLCRKELRRERWDIRFDIKTAHVIQAVVQSSIYFYWGQYYFGVREWAPFILFQLAFANILQFVSSILITRGYTVGMSVFPIVLSINLFMWAVPEHFGLQLMIVTAAIFGKSYFTRWIYGRQAHIFNPSALILAFASWIILFTHGEDLFQIRELVASYHLVPHILLFVFVVGCFSLWAGRVALISMGAVLSLFVVDFLVEKATGAPPMTDVIHPNVLIGLTLLVTDPATTPKTRLGQFLFGLTYGIGVILTYLGLQHAGRPTYFDKILVVPLLNYLAPSFDRVSLPFGSDRLPAWTRNRWAPLATYAALFLVILPTLERKVARNNDYKAWAASEPDSPPLKRLRPMLRAEWVRRCAKDSSLPVCSRN